jgi:DNA-binding PadR family transcriptional regulator
MDSQFPSSVVEMLILEVIGQGPTYGYEIAQTVAERSQNYFVLKEGSLYPALHRLERQKLLKASWREADGRRRKYYALTAAGEAELARRKRSWLSFAASVRGVLGTSRDVLGGAPGCAGVGSS